MKLLSLLMHTKAIVDSHYQLVEYTYLEQNHNKGEKNPYHLSAYAVV